MRKKHKCIVYFEVTGKIAAAVSERAVELSCPTREEVSETTDHMSVVWTRSSLRPCLDSTRRHAWPARPTSG